MLIIGAGLSGLAAARTLKAAGKSIKILEAADGIGGRVRTDMIGGFQLDRGFQVLLTAYPETKRFLDYKLLNLHHFKPGAMILNDQGKTVIGDPLRDPSALISTLLSPAGNLADKFRMLALKLKLSATSIDRIFSQEETSTADYLLRAGFSKTMMSQFFKPFMTGIFLEDKLSTSSRMFEFVFKMFSEGNTSLPAKGMGAIPAQLATGIEKRELVLNEKVIHIDGTHVMAESGKEYYARQVLLATDAPGLPSPFQQTPADGHSVLNLYFTASFPPFLKPLIALNARAGKTFNSIAVMDQIAPAYSANGRSLLSISVIGKFTEKQQQALRVSVQKELQIWFPEAGSWNYLKTYSIPYALPDDDRVNNGSDLPAFRLTETLFICGDHLLNGSINASLRSGRLAAEYML